MVVVDSSALIPLAWVGRFDLVSATVLYDLVNEGMNLHPKVYAQVQKKLQELGA